MEELNQIDKILSSEKPEPIQIKAVTLDNKFKRPRTSAKKNIPKDKRLKEEVSRTLMDQIYLEKEIENLKIGLAKCKDFSPLT